MLTLSRDSDMLDLTIPFQCASADITFLIFEVLVIYVMQPQFFLQPF